MNEGNESGKDGGLVCIGMIGEAYERRASPTHRFSRRVHISTGLEKHSESKGSFLLPAQLISLQC